MAGAELPNAEDLLGGPETLPSADDLLGPEAMGTGEYVGRRALQGMLRFAGQGAGLEGAEAGGLPWVPQSTRDAMGAAASGAQAPGAAQGMAERAGWLALPTLTLHPDKAPTELGPSAGSLATPPNRLGAYAGALAEGLTENPVMTMAAPGATAGGALGAEAMKEAFPNMTGADAFGGLVGGGLYGSVKALGRGLLHLDSIEHLASQLGNSETYQQAGRAIQSHISDWLSNGAKQAESHAWAPLDVKMAWIAPKGPQVDLKPFVEEVMNTAGNVKLGEMAPLANASSPPGIRNLVNGLYHMGLIDETGAYTGKTVPWNDVRAYSSEFGSQIKNPGDPISTIPDAKLKTLWSKLMGAQENTATANGAEEEFASAKEASRQINDVRKKLAPLVKPGVDPEDAAASMVGNAPKGGSALQVLRDTVPEATDELAAAHIRSGGWTNASPEAKMALAPTNHTAIDEAFNRQLPKVNLTHALGSEILGSLLGHGAGTLGLAHGGAPLGMMIGAGMPLAYYGGKAVLQQPNRLLQPIVGGLTGADLVGGDAGR